VADEAHLHTEETTEEDPGVEADLVEDIHQEIVKIVTGDQDQDLVRGTEETTERDIVQDHHVTLSDGIEADPDLPEEDKA